MSPMIHRGAGSLAMMTIALFMLATLASELFAPVQTIAQVKAWILFPGLLVLIPALALTGASGTRLASENRTPTIRGKQRRMVLIAANGLLILVPCAVLLARWSGSGTFDTGFYLLQGVELLAGGVNLILLGLNFRAGLRLAAARRSLATER